mmetsp:Transcript_62490/g.129809  ORF Transcript_62490/g.129809 Transcript_62490/m.129809 type:complete len:404 (+) Transcript_62490:222-1433(+)
METARKAEKKVVSSLSSGNLDKASTPSGKPEETDNEPSQLLCMLHAFLFLLTGIVSTICNQLVFYQGASQPRTLMLSAPTYVGMLLVFLLPVQRRSTTSTSSLSVFGCATMDVFSNISCMVGLQFVGSGIFQVLYASVVCFTAILSKACLGKSPSALQWLAILGIAMGLGLTSHGSAPAHLHSDTGLVLMGIGVTLVGCVGYASTYVMVEAILSRGNCIEPQRLCVCVGAFGTVVHFAYLFSYTFPNFEELVLKNIEKNQGNLNTVTMLYGILVLSAFIHNWNYFFLLRYSGAVTTGVISALRAIGVFIASGWMFCGDHPSQCMTAQKSLAAMVVASGVLLYSFGKKPAKKQQAGEMTDEAVSAVKPPKVNGEGRRKLEIELKRNDQLKKNEDLPPTNGLNNV